MNFFKKKNLKLFKNFKFFALNKKHVISKFFKYIFCKIIFFFKFFYFKWIIVWCTLTALHVFLEDYDEGASFYFCVQEAFFSFSFLFLIIFIGYTLFCTWAYISDVDVFNDEKKK